MSRGERPREEPAFPLVPCSSTSGLQNRKEVNFYCLTSPVWYFVSAVLGNGHSGTILSKNR